MRRALPLLLLAVLAACGPRGTALPAEGPVPELGPPTGTVQPGDRIQLKVFGEKDMNDMYTVQASGEAVLPRLGPVHVAGRTSVQLQDTLRRAYAEFLRNPAVEVAVLRRIGVQGEVRRPDLYMIDETTTLRDVIAQAGGLSDAGNPRKITVIREGQEIRLAGTERFSAAQLRSGDQVYIGKRSFLETNAIAILSTAGSALVTSLLLTALRR
ncbi:MAG TPA: polysaccharide biosynthesis/export family protein [Longimicrobiaceae bacterium]|jgi:polysaccharide export outer membrane protein|nr:polysaccharide biosynthesis/export family protein [Longimicrobiaceae bacterium]